MCTDIYAANNENMSENGWTLLRYIKKCRAIMKDRCAHWHMRCSACSQLYTMCLHACAVWPLSHRTSVKKQRIVSHEECTRFHAKKYASIRFCCRSGPTRARNVHVGHVQYYCPFTRSSFCNISQTLRTFCKECFFVVWKGLLLSRDLGLMFMLCYTSCT